MERGSYLAAVTFLLLQITAISFAQPFPQAYFRNFNVLGDQSCSIDGRGIILGLYHLDHGTFTNGENWYQRFVSTLPNDLWSGATVNNYCDAAAMVDASRENGAMSLHFYDGYYGGDMELGFAVADLNQQIDALIEDNEDMLYPFLGVTLVQIGYTDLVKGHDAEDVISDLWGQLGRLADGGFRNIGVFNMVPIDLYPLMDQAWFNVDFTDAAGARAHFSAEVAQFNSLLASELDAFHSVYSNTHVQIIDIHSVIVDAVNNPGNYGVVDPINPCVPDPRLPYCDDAEDRLFYDVHNLNTKVHQEIVNQLIDPLLLECWEFSNREFTSTPIYYTNDAHYADEVLYLSVGIPSNYDDVKFWYEGDTPGEPAYWDIGALPYREDRIEAGEGIEDYHWRPTAAHDPCYIGYESTVHWGDLLDGGAHMVREDDVTAPVGGWEATSVSGVLYSTSKQYKGEIRDEPIYSELSSRYPFTVYFPDGVEIVSGDCEQVDRPPVDEQCTITEVIRVYDHPNLLSAVVTQVIVSTKFIDEQVVQATANVFTSVQWPFKLVPVGTSSDVPQINNPDLNTWERVDKSDCDDPDIRFADDDLDEIPPAACNQFFQIDMKPNAGLVAGSDTFVCSIDGVYTVDFELVCQPGMDEHCPIDAASAAIQLQFALDSESWCPIVDFGTSFSGSITAYTSPDRTFETRAHDFLPDFEDHHGIWRRNIVYFQVELFSDEHVIEDTEIRSISITTSGDKKWLLLDGLDYAHWVGWADDFAYFNDVVPSNGEDIRSTCWFEFNLDPKILTIPHDDHILATIDVVLRVTYQNKPSRLLSVSLLYEQQFMGEEPIVGTLNIKKPELVVDEHVQDAGNGNPNPTGASSTLSTLMCFLCVLCVLLHH